MESFISQGSYTLKIKVPIKASVKRYHIGLKSFISGSIETSFKHLNIDPPLYF